MLSVGDAKTEKNHWFFFFSSRRRHTRFDCDWSSDVCSSDLLVADVDRRARDQLADVVLALPAEGALQRSVAFARSGHRLPTSSPASPAPAPRPPPASSAWTRSLRRRFYIPSPARRS